MTQRNREFGCRSVLVVGIQQEKDIVVARQRARQLAAEAGFHAQDQARIATAVSEIARNAWQYAGGGRVEFSIDLRSRPQLLRIEVSDKGPGIRDVGAVLSGSYVSQTGMGTGLAGTQRLMDEFEISSRPREGTTVRFGKYLPTGSRTVDLETLGEMSMRLAQEQARGEADEFARLNREVLDALEEVRLREAEIEKRHSELERLSIELEETNRGVVALYAELDEKALALRRANEMKSRFLSHVSHEFRTPVNSVLALSRLLLERSDGDLTSEQEKQVTYIREATQQLADLVNDLLDLAKVEAGKTEVRVSRVDVAQFLGATRALMKPLSNNDAVTLVFEEPPQGLALSTDESKLGQIVRNLISNALKFTQKGEVRVRAEAEGDVVVFTVKDTGVGIDPKHHEHIFQEFAQVENPLQKNVKGTGLGLPLSRKLALLLGGTLSVESEAGAGATFTLRLPVGEEGNTKADDADAAESPGDRPILIIDDEDPARYISQHLLRGTRRRIIAAAGGAEGAERARFEHPALILLDLMMPGRTGFEVLEELKSDERTRDIPVVIQTSRAMTQSDFDRLGGRQAAVLRKEASGRREALLLMRAILQEPDLFANEPEFREETGRKSNLNA